MAGKLGLLICALVVLMPSVVGITLLKHEYSEEKAGFVGFPTPMQHIDTYLASDK